MDFAALPPEINSARMYAGVGSGPLMASAAAWDSLAAQLDSFASGYSTTLTSVHGQAWSGAASNAMATAAAPYVAWIVTMAARADQAAGETRTAAAAYEAAFAMTVPPPVIEANRALLAALVATNFFGQNTPTIAATEVAYAEMWAQDAAAMHGYAAAALPAAATLAPLTAAPRTTSDGGQSAQHAAVAHAAVQTTQSLAQAASTTPNPPHAVAATSTASPSVPPASDPMVYITDWSSFSSQIFNPFWGIENQNANLAVTVNDDGDMAGYLALTPRKALLPDPALGLLGGKDPYLTTQVRGGPVVADAGRAAVAGQLSVPRGWATLAKTGSPAGWTPPQSVTAAQRVVAAEPAVSAKPAMGEPMAGQPPALAPIRGADPHYAGNPMYRLRDDRNFRMPRPAVGG